MSPASIRDRYDVVIAGARCAGAATALLLARRGVRVLVVDPLPRGRDTLSTHALMRGGVLQLHRWGLLDRIRAAGTPAVSATTFDYGDETITIPIKARDGVDALFAPRRTVLDPILAEAALDAGADVVHGLSVVDVLRGNAGRVTGARISGAGRPITDVGAQLVVGADGVRSRLARMIAAPIEREAAHAAACIFGYFPGSDAAEYRWTFRPGLSVGSIPTNGGETCIFVSVPGSRFAELANDGLQRVFRDTLQAADPALADRLRNTRPAQGLRGFAGIPGFLRRAAGPGWALVGDAGFFRDPITAHGITDAFRDAELLARAVFRGHEAALADYQHARDAVATDVMAVTDRIASFDWSLDEVKDLHQALSRAMNAGVEVVRTFDGPPDDSPDSRRAGESTAGTFAAAA